MGVTAATAHFSRSFDLPWTTSAAEHRRFRRIWLSCLAVVVVLGLVVPWLPVAERAFDAPPPVPPRFAKLVLERATPPPPPPPVAELPREEIQPQVRPRERPELREDPRPAPEMDRTQVARAKAAQAGLLPFVDELADLRDKFEVTPDHLKPTATASATTEGTPRAERALVTSRAGAASGGINTAAVSRGTGYGEGSLEGHGTTQLQVPFGGSGGGSAGRSDGVADGVSRSGSSKRASRSQEEIELVFDRNKAAIYALYNRALRDDPALRGKVVMQLTIAPSGEVTDIRIVSSELGDAELERKLVARVKMFRFEDKDVEAITTTKPIEFFPA